MFNSIQIDSKLNMKFIRGDREYELAELPDGFQYMIKFLLKLLSVQIKLMDQKFEGHYPIFLDSGHVKIPHISNILQYFMEISGNFNTFFLMTEKSGVEDADITFADDMVEGNLLPV